MRLSEIKQITKTHLDVRRWNQGKKLSVFIRTHCDQYVRQLSSLDRPLLRGMLESSHVQILRSPVDRSPRDSSRMQHTFLNALINAKGYVANRSNSIFSAFEYSIAHSYSRLYLVQGLDGAVYALFPIGEFDYTIADADMFSPDFALNSDYVRLNRLAYNFYTSYVDDFEVQNPQGLDSHRIHLHSIEVAYRKLEKSPDWWRSWHFNTNLGRDLLSKISNTGLGQYANNRGEGEVMLHANRILAIDFKFYKEFVLPQLDNNL